MGLQPQLFVSAEKREGVKVEADRTDIMNGRKEDT